MNKRLLIPERILKTLSKHRFLKNVMLVSGGTATAQLLVILFSPIISRIFSPDDFGTVAVYSSILAILSPLSTLRLHYAIPIEDNDVSAVNALFASFLVVCLTSVSVLLFALIGSDILINVFDAEPLRPYMWLLSVGLFGVGSYTTMNAWMLRRNHYKAIARTKVAQGFSRSISQIGLGLLGTGPLALVIGTIIGETAGIGSLTSHFLKTDKFLLKSIRGSSVLLVVKKYKEFILLGTWSAMLNMAASHVPVLFLSALYGAQMVGAFSFANKIIALPMTLVGASVAQVFFGEGAKYASSDPARLLSLVQKSSRRLFQLALILPALLVPFGPWLFSFVFGSAWFEAGEYARWLSILLVFRFSVQPFYEALDMLKRQRLRLVLSVVRVGLIALALFGSWKVGLSPLSAVVVYTGCMIVVYSLTYLVIVNAIKQRIGDIELDKKE